MVTYLTLGYIHDIAASKIGRWQMARPRGAWGNDKAHHYIGTYMTPHEAALNYSRYIGAQQADAEKVAEEASGENRKSSTSLSE